MANKQRFILAHAEARRRAIEAVKNAPEGYHVEIKEPTRSLIMNAKMWAILGDISDQVVWYGSRLEDFEWKDFFTAALRKSKIIPNIDHSGFVALGQSTRKMTNAEISDVCELALAFGANHDVKFKASKNAHEL